MGRDMRPVQPSHGVMPCLYYCGPCWPSANELKRANSRDGQKTAGLARLWAYQAHWCFPDVRFTSLVFVVSSSQVLAASGSGRRTLASPFTTSSQTHTGSGSSWRSGVSRSVYKRPVPCAACVCAEIHLCSFSALISFRWCFLLHHSHFHDSTAFPMTLVGAYQSLGSRGKRFSIMVMVDNHPNWDVFVFHLAGLFSNKHTSHFHWLHWRFMAHSNIGTAQELWCNSGTTADLYSTQ